MQFKSLIFMILKILYLIVVFYFGFSETSKTNNIATPPPSPLDNLLLETPIQFDLFSPAEDRERSQSMDPPER